MSTASLSRFRLTFFSELLGNSKKIAFLKIKPFPLPHFRLTAAVFSLSEMARRALAANMTSILSPQLASTIMWFLRRWTRAYLLPPENHYLKVSVSR